jgi:hypothetical protein
MGNTSSGQFAYSPTVSHVTNNSIPTPKVNAEDDGGYFEGYGPSNFQNLDSDAQSEYEIKTRKNNLTTQFSRLEANMKMYMIYDNYDSKNEVILSDLKKKEINQSKELKQLNEDRDKLKVVLDYDKTKAYTYVQGTKNISNLNIFLLILLIACIVLIIYRILTHPYGLIDIKNIMVEDLERISGDDLNKLSIGQLDDLDNILEQKIEELEMINNSNYNNKMNSNSVNITRSNLDKKAKFTLSSGSNNISSNNSNKNSSNNSNKNSSNNTRKI